MRVPEWSRPEALLAPLVAKGMVVGREGMMKMRDSSDVPRITCCGTCEEGALVANEVRDNPFHKLLREIGDRGWVYCGRVRGSSSTGRLDFGFVSVPKLISKQFNRYNSINTTKY